MLANGHVAAWLYPLGMTLDEGLIVRRRLDADLASNALLTKLALDATPNMNVKPTATVKSAKDFAKRIKALFGVN